MGPLGHPDTATGRLTGRLSTLARPSASRGLPATRPALRGQGRACGRRPGRGARGTGTEGSSQLLGAAPQRPLSARTPFPRAPRAVWRRRGASWAAAAILFLSARCGRSPERSAAEMLFPLSRRALAQAARGVQRTLARQAHHEHGPDFHDKYGNIVLLSGAVFCVSVWSYVATQTGIEWNLSPVGRVTPKEWREE
ncbi:cytochrome c oxidase subunit 7B, mitochondrial [Tiliqua scincoides]|uniref:cytochrome c oxidase subunit 7B, mitochondrial n=1 Tax=Tiliqua scincoides TaxID=71010 RepID=UPI00346232FE